MGQGGRIRHFSALACSVGGQGNAGVAGLVKATPYSIGYVELAYAIKNKLPMGG